MLCIGQILWSRSFTAGHLSRLEVPIPKVATYHLPLISTLLRNSRELNSNKATPKRNVLSHPLPISCLNICNGIYVSSDISCNLLMPIIAKPQPLHKPSMQSPPTLYSGYFYFLRETFIGGAFEFCIIQIPVPIPYIYSHLLKEDGTILISVCITEPVHQLLYNSQLQSAPSHNDITKL